MMNPLNYGSVDLSTSFLFFIIFIIILKITLSIQKKSNFLTIFQFMELIALFYLSYDDKPTELWFSGSI